MSVVSSPSYPAQDLGSLKVLMSGVRVTTEEAGGPSACSSGFKTSWEVFPFGQGGHSLLELTIDQRCTGQASAGSPRGQGWTSPPPDPSIWRNMSRSHKTLGLHPNHGCVGVKSPPEFRVRWLLSGQGASKQLGLRCWCLSALATQRRPGPVGPERLGSPPRAAGLLYGRRGSPGQSPWMGGGLPWVLWSHSGQCQNFAAPIACRHPVVGGHPEGMYSEQSRDLSVPHVPGDKTEN